MSTEMDLISKKDLLREMDISYGQLYRWKRKDLIPEDWFIRKSTFTGQETFFPRLQIIERIRKIQDMKDNLSLDELASVFSSDEMEISLIGDDLVKKGILSSEAIERFAGAAGIQQNLFDFHQVLVMYITEKSLKSGDVSTIDADMIQNLLIERYLPRKSPPAALLLLRKMGVSTCLILEESSTVWFDPEVKILLNLDFLTEMELLKTTIKNID